VRRVEPLLGSRSRELIGPPHRKILIANCGA
jgi:hypothetical protein